MKGLGCQLVLGGFCLTDDEPLSSSMNSYDFYSLNFAHVSETCNAIDLPVSAPPPLPAPFPSTERLSTLLWPLSRVSHG